MGGFRAPLYTACQLRNHTHRSISQQPAPTNHHYRTLFSQGFSTCSKFVSPYPYQPSFRLSSPKYGPVMYSLALKPSNCAFGTTQIVKVPSMGDSITEGTLNEWKKNPGDYVNQDEVVAVIDTDKVSVDINAPSSGLIEKHLVKCGETVPVGADLFSLTEGGESQTRPAITKQPNQTVPGVNLDSTAETSSSSPSPSKDKDFQAAKAPPTPASPEKPTASSSSTPSPQIMLDPASRTEERVSMTRLRKRIAERLKSAQNTAAALTTFQEVDMSNLMSMRSELNKEFVEEHQTKFDISESGDEIIYKNYVDISVAVATPTGLLVPVIRDCERKTIAELEADLVAIAKKARDGKIMLEEMAGGTFTISNDRKVDHIIQIAYPHSSPYRATLLLPLLGSQLGGIFGSLFGTPILNPPQSSILGLHAIKDRAVVKNGEIVIRPMMYLALTYDHRLVDGREAVLFLNRVKNGVEDPRRLLLDI